VRNQGKENMLTNINLCVLAFLELLKRSGKIVLCVALTTFCLIITSCNECVAQEGERMYEYSFDVAGIGNPSQAKAVLFHLYEWSITESFRFINDVNRFKISTQTPISYDDLQNHLSYGGYQLNGRIECGDGSILIHDRPLNHSDK
jgi:hypothetical protein